MQVKSIAEWEHSAILSTFIKLLFVIKTFVLSILSVCLRQVLLYIFSTGMANVYQQDYDHQLNQDEDVCNIWRISDVVWSRS